MPYDVRIDSSDEDAHAANYIMAYSDAICVYVGTTGSRWRANYVKESREGAARRSPHGIQAAEDRVVPSHKITSKQPASYNFLIRSLLCIIMHITTVPTSSVATP